MYLAAFLIEFDLIRVIIQISYIFRKFQHCTNKFYKYFAII